MIAAKSPLAPDHANSGRFNGLNTATSVVRADRIGPTGSESSEWKMAASRVTLPSTISSYTTSAWFSPSCGRAWVPLPLPSALSIFTTSAGRASLPASVAGSPVSGYAGGGAVDVVGAVVVVVVVSAAFLPPPPHAASSPSATRTTAVRRIMLLQLPQRSDSFLERRMRVEEPVEAGQLPLLRRRRHRLLDPEMSGGTRVRVHDGLVVAQLLERGDQTGRIARELDPRHVGQRLSASTHGELHELGDDRRHDQQREP